MRAVQFETAAVRAVFETAAVRAAQFETAAVRAVECEAAECETEGRRIKGAGEGVARGGRACSAMPRAGLA